jgi:23S rRNA pseudouridine2605 synthase
MTDTPVTTPAGDRLAKIIARAGLCSRRDAELWIKDGRVSVNGKVVKTPAFNVTDKDRVKIDGEPLAARQGTRVWLYHKPPGLVVTEKDPEGRTTIFEALEEHGLPRVVTIGRLDINTEGLLLLTNDGGLKRVLELPATGWLRRYRVRAHGTVTQAQLDQLKDGIEVEGIKYGPIEAVLEREQGSNVWLVLALREGKNREVKNVLAALGLQVNRLIRISYGPFQLGDIPAGAVETVRARVLRDQLGKRLADESGADFDSDMPEQATATERKRATNPKMRAAAPGKPQPRQRPSVEQATAQFRFVDRDRPEPDETQRPRRDRPGGGRGSAPRRDAPPPRPEAPLRTVHHEDGTTSQVRVRQPRPEREERPARPDGDRPARKFVGAKRAFTPRDDERGGDRPARRPGPGGDRPGGDRKSFGDKPRGERSFGDKRFGDKKPFGDKRPYAGRSDGDGKPRGDRPVRSYGDKPKFGEKRDFGDKPKRDFADRPKRDFGDRPKRDFGDKPAGARAGGRPSGGRPDGGRPASSRPAGDRPRGPRPAGDSPRGPRPGGDKPRGARPGGDRPGGPRPPGGAPRGPRPGGDKPRAPRKPRA